MAPVLKGSLFFTVLPQAWTALPVRPPLPGACGEGDEPCPWRACPYAIDNAAHPEVTCAIDVTEDGPVSLMEAARTLGVTRIAVWKTQSRAMRKVARHPDRDALLRSMRGEG